MLAGPAGAAETAARSRALLDRPLSAAAELWVATVAEEACVLGAFQRAAQLGARPPGLIVRRGSGGPEVLVGPGTVHVALALAHPAALLPCDEKRIVNRHVRPLLRALAAVGSPAAFFGRDWISVAKHPAGWVGFAHDSATRRTVFEAFIAVTSPFAHPERPSFLGKAPGTLQTLTGRVSDPARVAGAVAQAYAAIGESETGDAEETTLPQPDGTSPASPGRGRNLAATSPASPGLEDPAWAATCDEAIGTLGAGPDAGGVFRIGGDLLVSRDALTRLETRVAGEPEDEIGRIVDETLAVGGVALDGVRSLASVRDVIVRARRR
jgi:hypothetical protein